MWRTALLVTFAGVVGLARGQQQVAPLQPFNSIRVCTPFNVLISPAQNAATPYAIYADADQGVKSALNATVSGGVLTLATAAAPATQQVFNTQQPIKIVITLPADQLAGVDVSSVAAITVAVATGFTSASLAASVTGTSILTFLGITATATASIVNSGTGTIVMAGALPAVTVVSAGTGAVYLSGAAGTVAVDVSGVSNVYIVGAATTAISGTVSGVSSIKYSAGTCTIPAQFGVGFGAPCTQQPITVPTQQPQFSCGLALSGYLPCSPSSAGSSSSAVGSGAGSSMSTFSSGGGTATATSSGDGDGDGNIQTSSSTSTNGVTVNSGGAGGQSSLVTATGTLQGSTCPATINLNMV